MKTTLKQSRKVGVAGSFQNQLMGNNSTLPVVGQGATHLMYSDRHPYQVIEVSKDGKTAKLEAYDATADKTQQLGEGHQNWILTPTGRYINVTWKQGAWRIVGREIVYTKEFIEKAEAEGNEWHLVRSLTEEQRKEIYQGDVRPQKVVEGITREKKRFDKISIIFGIMEYNYDWSF